jgi:hypothetical protein
MGDFKHAELALSKEVAQDGLHMHDATAPTVAFESYIPNSHTISGELNGTQFLDLGHVVNGGCVVLCVGIRCGAISSDMKLSFQAARSIG